MNRDEAWQHRRDVTSAMYFLVWHIGVSYDQAEDMVMRAQGAIGWWAEQGRAEGRKCFSALKRLCDIKIKRQFDCSV